MKAKLILMALASALLLVGCEKEYSARKELEAVSASGKVCPFEFELMYKTDSYYKTLKITKRKTKNKMRLVIFVLGKGVHHYNFIADDSFDSCEIEGVASVSIKVIDTVTQEVYSCTYDPDTVEIQIP